MRDWGRAALIGAVMAVLVHSAVAALVSPTAMTVFVPAGSNNGTRDGRSVANAFVDDAVLDSITFGGQTFVRSEGDFVEAVYAKVLAERGSVNAEYGVQDDGSDGCPNPFVKAGLIAEGAVLPQAVRESIDPAIQDAAIRESFACFSLTEGVDGEGANYVFDIVFNKGLVDNNDAADSIPEMLFFERGVNSDFTVQAIVGGSLDSPTLAPNTVSVNRGNLWGTGYYISTIEIVVSNPDAQQLGAVGIDLSDFFTGATAPVYGLRVTSANGSGADLYGQFLSALSDDQFRDLPPGLQVPEPTVGMLLALGVCLLAGRRSRS